MRPGDGLRIQRIILHRERLGDGIGRGVSGVTRLPCGDRGGSTFFQGHNISRNRSNTGIRNRERRRQSRRCRTCEDKGSLTQKFTRYWVKGNRLWNLGNGKVTLDERSRVKTLVTILTGSDGNNALAMNTNCISTDTGYRRIGTGVSNRQPS